MQILFEEIESIFEGRLKNMCKHAHIWRQLNYVDSMSHHLSPHGTVYSPPRFESMSFVVNILACKLKIVNNRNWKKT